MSNGTKAQKNRKNNNRPKAGEIGYKPSIQRNYNRKQENTNQATLFTK